MTEQNETARRYGEYVGRLMVARGWTRNRLAEQAGISPGTVGTIVKGAATAPPPEQIAAIARALKVTPNDIYDAAGWFTILREEWTLSPAERDIIAAYRTSSDKQKALALNVLRLNLDAVDSGGIVTEEEVGDDP